MTGRSPGTRKEREQEFHDRAFGEGVRSSTQRFYSVTAASTAFYDESLAALCAGQRALEYGCGPGSAAFFLARNGARVTGIDISPVAIAQAGEEAERQGLSDRVEFRVMDAESLEFEDDSFDLVCGTGILHHLDLDRAYPELARVLNPEGRAVFVEPLGHNPLINLYRRLTPGLRTEDEHPLLADDLRRASEHFGEVSLRFFHLLVLLALPLRRWRRFDSAVDLLGRGDDALFRRIPAARRYAWQVAITVGQPAGA